MAWDKSTKEVIDWLYDPLTDIKKSYVYATMINLDSELNSKWAKYHWATRVKLEALDYFCRQIIGATCMPIEMGLYKMQMRLVIWNLDAFFYEMVASHERLMQELNILYGGKDALAPADTSWDSIKTNFIDKLSIKLVAYIDKTINEDWFRRIYWYRDAATQHFGIMGESKLIRSHSDDKIWNWDDFDQYITYVDGATGETKKEHVDQCYDYLNKMIEYVTTVWNEISTERKR